MTSSRSSWLALPSARRHKLTGWRASIALFWLALASGPARAEPGEEPLSDRSAIEHLCDVHEDMACFKIGGAWGFMDKFGKLAGEPRFANAGDFSEGLAAVELGERWGFVDKTSELVIPPSFDYVNGFATGLAAAKEEEDGSWGYIDRHGQWVIAPAYEQAGPFQGETAMVSERGQGYLLIDRRGQVVKRFEAGLEIDVAPDAWGLYHARRQGARWLWHRDDGLFPAPEAMKSLYDAGEGLLSTVLRGQNGRDALWGTMDIQGRWTVPARFASIGLFQEGLAIAQTAEPAGGDAEGDSLSGRSVGLIDRQGRFVLPPKYERITRQAWGGYQATYAGKAGSDIIGRDGRVLLPAATCPSLREVSVALSVETAQWSVVAGCERSWAFHARTGMVRSRISAPGAYASGTHLMLIGRATEGTQVRLQFDIFDTTGRRVVSSEDRALQGDQALMVGDTVSLVPSGEAATERSRLDLLPLAVVVRWGLGREKTQIITRDGQLVFNPEWGYGEMSHFVSSYPGGPGGKPLEGPLVMSTREPPDEPFVMSFSGDDPSARRRWGAIDGRGQWVVQPQYYDYLNPFQDGAALASNGMHPMVVERDGKSHVLPRDVQRITRVSQGAFIGSPGNPDDPLVRLDLATGQITRITFPGKVDLKDFHEGLVSASDPDGLRWGLLDDKGEWAVPPRFDSRLDPVLDANGRLVGWRSAVRFHDGDISGRLFGWLDAKGRELLVPGYSDIEYDAKHGMLQLTMDEKFKGLMAPDGQVLLAVQYEDIEQLGKIFVEQLVNIFVVKEPAQYGLLDARGEWSAPLATLVRPRRRDLPYEQTRSGAERVLIDLQGRRSTASAPLPLAIAHGDPSQWWWSSTEYTRSEGVVTVFYGFDFKERVRLPGRLPSTSGFSEDIIAFTPSRARGKNAVALADRSGKVLGQYPYQEIGRMSEGYAAFKQVSARHAAERRKRMAPENDAEDPPTRTGFLNRQGKVAIPPVFERARPFAQSRAVVVVKDNIGMIDTSGKLLVHSAWLCGREPVILDANGRVQWPAEAAKQRKCN